MPPEDRPWANAERHRRDDRETDVHTPMKNAATETRAARRKIGESGSG
jgi:hypothetical protein